MRLCLLLLALSLSSAFADAPMPRMVDIRSSDGTLLKATFYPAAKPGPGVLLLHQGNRTRQSWDGLAKQLAAAGINTLSYDMRLHGESGGIPLDKMTAEQHKNLTDRTKDDAEAGLLYLALQPGVRKDDIGIGMAGWPGVVNGVEAARRHPEQVKSMVLMSGETTRDGLKYLHETPTPELFVVSDRDEYPPTVEAMGLLYVTASSPGKRWVRYSALHDAPWLWYETAFSDQDKVASTGDHGTDLFKPHPELPGIIVDWFVTTLITTPGHAPVEAAAAAPILNKLEWGGAAGIAEVTQQLEEARKKDPQVQLFPEADVDIIGEDYDRAGDPKSAIQVFKLNLFAYPNSIDAHTNLMDSYMQDGQKDLARPLAEESLKLLDEGKMPLSSWADTPVRRGESRKDIEDVLRQLKQGTAFRDCPDCPEMVTVPDGSFTMGSSDAEKAWVVAHGGTLDSVADEAPQHGVKLHTFAIGEYDVTRAEYAAFVKDTGHPTVKGCYQQGNPDSPFYPDATWQAPGFAQTDRDPVVCVNWHDAQAYVAWLNSKTKGGYRLPTEAEWEYAARGGAVSKFWWGEDENEIGAPDHAWFKDNAGGATHPVGQKPANGFGLYDVAGDVWQWTEDCYAETYVKAPIDGSAASGDPACRRSDRGSSWYYPAWLLRAATRERNPPDYKDGVLGFRVAKTLP